MTNMTDSRVTTKSISMYPEDEATLLQIGKDLGLRSNLSGIIRFLLHDWKRLKARENGNGDGPNDGGRKAAR